MNQIPASIQNTPKINRPTPILSDLEVVAFKRRMGIPYAIEALLAGHHLLINDYYSSGLNILNELKRSIFASNHQHTYADQRKLREQYQILSNKIIVKIQNHHITIRKAPDIGWLKILYPEYKTFLLTFPQIQGLNSSWQWYTHGIFIPVLNSKLHPYYGIYFPTRFEHLELFEQWLTEYNDPKDLAYDIGIGSGVLSFQMLKHGFQNIIGTDNNPNAIIGIQQLITQQTNLQNQLTPLFGDLFCHSNEKANLIVFNPPWIPSIEYQQGIDNAIFYTEKLFSDFFKQAAQHLTPQGKIVILFSNLAQITKQRQTHPIEDEISQGGVYKLERLLHQQVKRKSASTKRDAPWRNQEKVELWVLTKKSQETSMCTLP